MEKQLQQLYLVLCFIQIFTIQAQENPEVVLSTGKVRGLRLVSAANKVYYSFRGIPYAAPPTGFFRFKAPRPPTQWNQTLDAFEIPPACAQPWRTLKFPEKYSEDCLYINVFTPHLKPPRGALMPVMVWIHGGKHYQGSSTNYKYGADFLVTEDVVVVTFNYRLGVFGYLNVNSRSAQGNAALKDQVAALKWVQKEITQFGGDPNVVTIFGGSSGGQDVSCLYHTKMAQGLFHRAISHSSMTCQADNNSNGINTGLKLAKMMGCFSTDVEATVACLRDITEQVLAEKQMNVITPEPGQGENPFDMTVEQDLGEEVFLSVPTEELLSNSKSKVPYLMGMNSGEGLMYVKTPDDNPTQFSDFERDFVLYLPNYIRENSDPTLLNKIVKKLKSFYFDDKSPSLETVYRFIDFITDVRFTLPNTKTAKIVSKHAPVYFYYFVFEGEFESEQPVDVLNLSGVNHGNELGYLFYRNALIPAQNHMADYPRECATLTRMVRLWTNFAKYGDPTPNSADELLGVTWLQMNENLTQHLFINDTLYMVTQDLLPERVAVWETVYSWIKPDEETLYVGHIIIAAVLILALISLLYLSYSCCRRNEYIELPYD